jgi:hypothetical protein
MLSKQFGAISKEMKELKVKNKSERREQIKRPRKAEMREDVR